MNTLKKMEYITEYNENQNIGKVKYIVNFHRQGNYHKDGSKFFDIAIFKNKRAKDNFIKTLKIDKPCDNCGNRHRLTEFIKEDGAKMSLCKQCLFDSK